MAFFNRKQGKEDEDFQDEEFEEKSHPKKSFKDLKPENKKRRKEPVKPWGKKERMIVFSALAITVLTALFLTISSTEFAWPKFSGFSLPQFGSGTITIEGTKEQREKAANIRSAFNDKVSQLSGTYGFYVIDLSNGFGFGQNENEIFRSAPFNKFQVLAAIFTQAQEGKLDPNAVTEIALLVGSSSDSATFEIPVKKLGGEQNIERVVREIGMNSTSFVNSSTTPKDMGIFFKKLYRGEIVSEKYSDEILGLLTSTTERDLIPRGVAEGVKVSHKYGTIDSVVNDAGIVFAQKPYVLVIMSKSADLDQARKVIPEISEVVFEIITK